MGNLFTVKSISHGHKDQLPACFIQRTLIHPAVEQAPRSAQNQALEMATRQHSRRDGSTTRLGADARLGAGDVDEGRVAMWSKIEPVWGNLVIVQARVCAPHSGTKAGTDGMSGVRRAP